MSYIHHGGPAGNSFLPGRLLILMRLQTLHLHIGHLAQVKLGHFVVLMAIALSIVSSPVFADDESTLHKMRAARREAIKSYNLAAEKSDGPALFGLLVIPVDFSDARLPADWNPNKLTGRLTSGSQESLTRYFNIASGGRLDLRITQAPVVHLAGTRRDYSDIGWNGFSRTRALATESLEAVRELGLEFRRLDMDGPDRIPGTDDDDGDIDGVLILHSGIGQENDTDEGLIQALQFFLDEPVASQGVSATFYSVASLSSGPGIWAHETGHLLGLEDRYDPGLRPTGGSEVHSLGGLGRFSLMASGAWGTGEGYGAALPDAYSSFQLGWYRARNLTNSGDLPDTLRAAVESGQVDRLWTGGTIGPEFFLLETRDPVAAYPYDADVPGGELLIYHIDENLAEGRNEDHGDGTWHLRASLVEADNDFRLRTGQDPGRPEDLFPGPLRKSDFGPGTTPSSWGYTGNSRVSLEEISAIPSGVTYRASVWPGENLNMSVGFSGEDEVIMDLVARSSGTPFEDLSCIVSSVPGATWGTFPGGQLSIAFDLVDDGQGNWRPVEPVVWVPSADIPSNARTYFHYSYQFGTLAEDIVREWYWKDNADVLDFSGPFWPGQWSVSTPDNIQASWHRWNSAPWLTADQTPVLACTGFEDIYPSAWPDVVYGNSAYTILTSGSLGPDVQAVRLIHGMEVEYLSANVAMDGGTVAWVDSEGREFEVEPLSGWRGKIEDKAFNILHGRNALIQKDLELESGIPLWRTDIIPVPEGLPGPWRLKLSFGSNTLWRHRGWFVASVDPIYENPAESSFEGQWVPGPGGGLRWSWPWSDGGMIRFIIQHRVSSEDPWVEIADELFPYLPAISGYEMPASRVSPYLKGSPRKRYEMRILGFIDQGKVATRDVVVFPDGGDGRSVSLGLPWPNPANGSVRVLVEVPNGGQGDLGIYDLRGRRILERVVGAGSHLLEWDGLDNHGRRVASGTYIIRLEGSGPAVMRKVVLLN